VSEFPPHSPFRRGERVQLHGFPGYHLHHAHALTDLSVIGFRGTVAAYLGGTVLTVTTDTGRTWVGHWDDLSPEGTPCRGDECGCCTTSRPPPAGAGAVPSRPAPRVPGRRRPR
jgi:hypothetical protein